MLRTAIAWPIWCGCFLMIWAAVIERRKRKVPNAFTMPAAVAGIVVAWLFGEGGSYPALHGGVESSLGVAVSLLVVLVVLWRRKQFPGGCAKMQVAFAAWLGCALPYTQSLVVCLASVAAVLLGLCLAPFAAKRSASTSGEDESKQRLFTQSHVAFLTIGTVVICGLAGLV